MLKPRITELWEAKGLTVEALAAKVGLSHTYITRMANGKRNASLKNLEKIARALDCTVSDLVGPSPDKLEDIVLEAWAAIPQGRREDAMRMLRALGDGDAAKHNRKAVADSGEQVERPVNAPPVTQREQERRKTLNK